MTARPILIAALLVPSSAFAVTLTVGPTGSYPTINAALANANDGDTIEIEAGTYIEALAINNDLTIVGIGGSSAVFIQSGAPQVIDINNRDVILEGLTIQGNANHGMWVHNSASLQATDVQVVGINSNTDGAGMLVQSSDVSLVDCVFDQNHSDDDGGAIDIDSGLLIAEDTQFLGNSANDDGGAIRAAFSDVLLTNVTFSNNVGEGNNAGTGAPNGGGALYARTGSFVDIVGGLFEQNNVGGGIGVGGGLVGSDSDVNIDGTVFRLNRGEDGGGVLWSGGVATLTNTVFDGNEAGSTGGGVRAEAGAELFISDSSFTGNSADFGGAIYGRGTVWVTNVSVLGNEAGVNGGGLRWFPDGFDGSTLLVEDSVFQDNIAGDIGGGIASASTGGVQGEIEVLDSNFTRNFALRGGGLSTENNNGLVVQRNIFCGNSGTNSSGAARVLGSALNGQLWTNNVFVENTSIGFGGGIFMSDSGDAEIINNTFLANDAPDGGNLYTELTTVDVYNNIIAFAPDGGGYSADSNGGERNYNLWFSNTPSDATGNLVPGDLGSDAVFADPMLSLYQADGLCGNDAFTPAVGSPAIDAGTPGPLDLDGSPIDIGAYGGQSADPGILLDDDGDGFTAASDCDDNDAGVFPGAAEVCDGIDNDCDGDIDGALAPGATDWYPDYDGDGFGSEADIITACDPPADYIATGGDCNDRVDTINPSAAEICDDLDNDCNDLIDDGLTTTYYYDQDADGYGDPNNAFDVCDAPPENTTTEPGDCDDVNPDINPGMEEICDGIDNDCNGDADTELYATWYRDADGDEFGYDDNTRDECEQPQGYVEVGGDCNDANANINPAAIDENIDTVDQDCDGTDGQPYSAEALLARSECGCSATENPMGGWWAMLGIMSLLARRRRDR